jgi:glycerophosphoryl diester phosphodiesterase
MRAFELARREGADGVELDVRLTADSKVVVAHDPALARVSSGESQGEVERLSFAELARVDVGEGERIPLLEGVLDWAAQHALVVNVEVKSDVKRKGELLRALIELLAARQRQSEQLLLSSFHPGFVLRLGRALPSFGVAWLVHEKQRLTRLLPAFRRLGAIGVNPQHTLLSSAMVRRYHEAGALISTWTVNDPLLAAAYAAFGVDAVISDCPGDVLAAFKPAEASSVGTL